MRYCRRHFRDSHRTIPIGIGAPIVNVFTHAPPPAILATLHGVRFSGVALGAYSRAAFYRGPAACPAKPGAVRRDRSAIKGAVISRLATKRSRRRVSQSFRRSIPACSTGAGRTVSSTSFLRGLVGRSKPAYKATRTAATDGLLRVSPGWGVELVTPHPIYFTISTVRQ